jgi:DNA-binding NarL/FixJ family response regulator
MKTGNESYPPPAFEGVPAYKIIIIEDDLMYAKALQLRLERACNCKVVKIYHDGLSFLNDMKNLSADFIIIDYELPDTNGSEIMQQIQESGMQIPVILITTYKFPEYIESIGAEGALAYVEKKEIGTICDIILGKNYSNHTDHSLSVADYELLIAIVTLPLNKDLAYRFNVGIEAIKKRKAKLSIKLGIRNNRDAFKVFVQQNGLI